MRRLGLLWATVVLFSAGPALASLNVIGTATYQGNAYNLIYESGLSVVWLDYTNPAAPSLPLPSDQYPRHYYWQYQMDWAAGLNNPGVLTYNLNPGVSVTWNGNWNLPSASVHPLPYTNTSDDSQFSYLDFTDLGNHYGPPPSTNTGPFNNLELYGYWLSTEVTTGAYDLRTSNMIAGGADEYLAFNFHPDVGMLGMCEEWGVPDLGIVDAPVTVTGLNIPDPGPGPEQVPAPGALLLASLGLSVAGGWLRRRKELV